MLHPVYFWLYHDAAALRTLYDLCVMALLIRVAISGWDFVMGYLIDGGGEDDAN